MGDAVWDFYDNTTGNDGETVTSTVLTASDVRETYEEDNPTVTNPNSASVGQDAEWDFALDPANATTTTYYFRIVTSDGEPLTSYSSYPTVTIGAGGGGISLDQLMRHGKWFDNGVRQPFTF